MTDPKYVRLAPRLTRGMRADVEGSGWSIAGFDVQEFPTGKAAVAFVRRELAAGRLEVASKAEYDETHNNDLPLLEDVPHQEGQVRDAAAKLRAETKAAEAKKKTDSDESAPQNEEPKEKPKPAPKRRKAAAK